MAHRLRSGASMADLIQALAELGVERVKKKRFGVGSRSREVLVRETSVHDESRVGADFFGDEVVHGGDASVIVGVNVGAEVCAVELTQGNESSVIEGVDLEQNESSIIEGVHVAADVFEEVSCDELLEVRERTRHIPMSIRRAVYLRAEGRCEYKDRAMGRRCNSVSFVQLDHQDAFAKGGEHSLECIVLACWSHNGLRAVRDFGAGWMGRFRKTS